MKNPFLKKNFMVALLVLALPNSDKPLILEIDNSNFAVGAILL